MKNKALSNLKNIQLQGNKYDIKLPTFAKIIKRKVWKRKNKCFSVFFFHQNSKINFKIINNKSNNKKNNKLFQI